MDNAHITPNDLPASIVAELRAGSHRAFRQVFDYYYDRLLRYAAKICYTGEQAEDVVQEVFISLWEHRTSLTHNEVTGWLIQVCRNKAIKSLRRQILLTDLSALKLSEQPGEHMPDHLHYKDIESRIAAAIEALPPSRRKIFLLSRESDMTYQQIADQMGISVKTVEAQMSSALRQIRSSVSPFAYTILLLIIRQY